VLFSFVRARPRARSQLPQQLAAHGISGAVAAWVADAASLPPKPGLLPSLWPLADATLRAISLPGLQHGLSLDEPQEHFE